MSGITHALAERIAAQRLEDAPEAAIRVATQCLLDWIGVAIAARDEPLVRILIEDAVEDGGHGDVTVIGSDARLTPLQAAMVNGAMGHALDYDDVIFMGHPTAPVAPAVFAAAERRRSTGADMLAAFIAGFETECRVARFVGPSHYARGWHSTGTFGTFGAAAAAGHLYRLSAGQFRHAFGLAATQASGLKSMFGTMAKPFHAGHAARGGLFAARLAGRGFSANEAAIEAAQGFADTQSDATRPDDAAAEPPGGYFLPGTLFKYHAACYLTHSSIEAAQALRRAHNLDLDAIEAIEISVDPGHLSVCNIAAPQTGLECKFSLSMTAAMALKGEATSDEALYSDATAQRPDLISLSERVSVTPTSRGTTARLTLRLADGSVLDRTVDVATPERDLDAQQSRLEQKFRALVAPRMGDKRAEAIIETISSLRDLKDSQSLFALLRRA